MVFLGILVSASGAFLMLYLWGANMSVAVWVGFIALFGVSDDDSVVMLTYLEQVFGSREPRSIAEIREMVLEAVQLITLFVATCLYCLVKERQFLRGSRPVGGTLGEGAEGIHASAERSSSS